MTRAMSSGWPTRRSGICSAVNFWKSSNSTPTRSAVCAVICVTMKPGATQLTLMPNGPSSMASVFVIPWMPAFAAAVVRLAAVAIGGRSRR